MPDRPLLIPCGLGMHSTPEQGVAGWRLWHGACAAARDGSALHGCLDDHTWHAGLLVSGSGAAVCAITGDSWSACVIVGLHRLSGGDGEAHALCYCPARRYVSTGFGVFVAQRPHRLGRFDRWPLMGCDMHVVRSGVVHAHPIIYRGGLCGRGALHITHAITSCTVQAWADLVHLRDLPVALWLNACLFVHARGFGSITGQRKSSCLIGWLDHTTSITYTEQHISQLSRLLVGFNSTL